MIVQEVKRPMIAQPSSPLDLRLKRVAVKSSPRHDGTDGEEEKENRRSDGNITDAEDIVCAPSIPCMIMSPSSSPTSAGNKTPQQRPGSGAQPINGVIQKFESSPETSADHKNGKFSMSNLLHVSNRLENMKRESASPASDVPVQVVQPQPAMLVHRYNPIHKSRNVGPPSAPGTLPPTVQRPNVDLLTPTTVLPYFTSDMTLRLTPNPAIDTLVPAHQFYLKQGPSKCESCNIVFCKYENFLAHKKHYCASRPTPPPLQPNDVDDADKSSPEGSPGSRPLMIASPQSSKDSVSPTPLLKPPMIQFICSTCGVKFSSFDNLTTHQSFYCPNRMTAGQDPPIVPVVTEKLLSKCPKCKVSSTHGCLLFSVFSLKIMRKSLKTPIFDRYSELCMYLDTYFIL